MLENYDTRKFGNCPVVLLDSPQIQSGVNQGTTRNSESLRMGLENKRGLPPEDALKVSIQGSLGEIAVHVYAHLPFKYSINEFGQPDVVTKRNILVDVKTQKRAEYLYVSPRHLHPDWVYLLVLQLSRERYVLIGYISGDKVPNYPLEAVKGRTPVYCIPHAALTRITSNGVN